MKKRTAKQEKNCNFQYLVTLSVDCVTCVIPSCGSYWPHWWKYMVKTWDL